MTTPSPQFFVTGPPRSRGAWLANLLTTDKSSCVHDPLQFGSDSKRYIDALDDATVSMRRGLSDSGFGTYGQDLISKFPSAPILVVNRDLDDARRSFISLMSSIGLSQSEAESGFNAVVWAGEWILDCPHMTVDYDRLSDVSTVREVWSYLLPGLPFDEDRFHLMTTFNVTTRFAGVLPWVG